MTFLAVFVGGAFGAALRFLLGLAEGSLWRKARHPNDGRGTLAANVIACALVGAFATALMREDQPLVQPLLIAGLCGGMSTFSAFALEVFTWLEDKRYSRAAVMVTITCVLGAAAFALGTVFAQ